MTTKRDTVSPVSEFEKLFALSVESPLTIARAVVRMADEARSVLAWFEEADKIIESKGRGRSEAEVRSIMAEHRKTTYSFGKMVEVFAEVYLNTGMWGALHDGLNGRALKMQEVLELVQKKGTRRRK